MIKRFLAMTMAAALVSGCQVIKLKDVKNNLAQIETGEELAPVALAKIRVDIRRGEDIGGYGIDLIRCLRPYQSFVWGAGRHTRDDIELADIFFNEMDNAGHDVVGDPNQLFDEDKSQLRAEYKVGGQIEKMRMNLCKLPSFWTAEPRAIEGDAYMRVKWQVYSNWEKRVVYAITTEGRGKSGEETMDGETIAIQNAFASAVNNFAADKKLIQLLRRTGGSSPARARSDPARDRNKTVALPEVPKFRGQIARNINRLKSATVTVATGVGHGSGFFISEEGLVLTNNHVVGDARFITVQLANGREIIGEVLRRDRRRDVALILVEGRGYVPLPVRKTPVRITEDVYAIGTPRTRKLANTVTKGVVSAMRTHPNDNDMEYIQADVDIHGGNSGGPLVDAKGNLVGITVAGYQGNADGASIGLNLFIPILDGLRYLGLEVRKMPKSYSPVKQFRMTGRKGAPKS